MTRNFWSSQIATSKSLAGAADDSPRRVSIYLISLMTFAVTASGTRSKREGVML